MWITGAGVVSTVGDSVSEFAASLREGRSGIERLAAADAKRTEIHVAASIRNFSWPSFIKQTENELPAVGCRAGKVLRNTPDSIRWSVCAAIQAYKQARLHLSPISSRRFGLIIAGSNLHQRYIFENVERFLSEPEYIAPRYAISFSDSHQVGVISEILSIHGPGITVGGVAASGNVALYQALGWLRSGMVDACLVCGAAADFSLLELKAFAILGAAFTGEPTAEPEKVCRPFDRQHKGCVWGQGSACLVLETRESAGSRGTKNIGELAGASCVLDGNHLPDPRLDGEVRAMRNAIEDAGITPEMIDYLNTHGTASPLGDQIECEAIRQVFGTQAQRLFVNATKPLTGHCFSSAGIVEAVASLIQLNEGFVHPSLNLETPIDEEIGFVGKEAKPFNGQFGLSNSFGFGGINSCVVLRRSTESQPQSCGLS